MKPRSRPQRHWWRKIVGEAHETPDEAAVKMLQQSTCTEKNDALRTKLDDIKNSLPPKTKRAVDFVTEKGASNTVIPLKEMDFNLNKREFEFESSVKK